MITVKPAAARRSFCIDLVLSGGRSSLPAGPFLSRVQSLLKAEKFTSCALSVVLVSDPFIRRLNRRYKKRNRATDVLAFDLGSGARHLAGDVIVSLDTARRMAKALKISTKEELWRYVVHGILHLAGYDDLTPRNRKKMWERQEYFVSGWIIRVPLRPRNTA